MRAPRILALVGDAYGARGGIARYNRDLFEALAGAGAEIVILPRLGDGSGVLPAGVRQQPAIFGRLKFSLMSLRLAWRHRPVDILFCGHVLMAPLAVVLARLFGARYWVQAHGTDIIVTKNIITNEQGDAVQESYTTLAGRSDETGKGFTDGTA